MNGWMSGWILLLLLLLLLLYVSFLISFLPVSDGVHCPYIAAPLKPNSSSSSSSSSSSVLSYLFPMESTAVKSAPHFNKIFAISSRPRQRA